MGVLTPAAHSCLTPPQPPQLREHSFASVSKEESANGMQHHGGSQLGFAEIWVPEC